MFNLNSIAKLALNVFQTCQRITVIRRAHLLLSQFTKIEGFVLDYQDGVIALA